MMVSHVAVESEIEHPTAKVLPFPTGFSSPTSSVWRPALLLVAFYAIAANLPYWTACNLLHLLPLGWIALEFLFIGLLALLLPRLVTAFLLLLTFAADIVAGISRTYHLHPYDCFANLTVLNSLPPARLLSSVIVTSVCCLVAAIPIVWPGRKLANAIRVRTALLLVALSLLALASDILRMERDFHAIGFLGPITRNDINHISNWGNLWMGRYPAFHFFHDPYLFAPQRTEAMAGEHTSLANFPPIQSATSIALESSHLLEAAPTGVRPNLMLVLVESWGLANDTEVSSPLTLPYAQPEILAHYRVLQGSLPFHGATVGGETRELCQSTVAIGVLKIAADQLTSCLPDTLRGLGYSATAMHGMDGRVFDRIHWYPRIGFQQAWFGQHFRGLGLPDCSGAFVGTCDADIAQSIRKLLTGPSSQPQFLYWVTLNSHLPVPTPPPLEHPAPCPIAASTPNAPTLCSWFQLVANVHTATSRIALDRQARPTVFVIVGDHTPPFNSSALNAHFNQSIVPYVILIPR